MYSLSSDYFDTVYDRHTAGDIKYQSISGVENVIPMWIADMDFKAPPAVEEALIKSANHGIFGYTEPDEEYDGLVISWYKRRMGWSIKPEWIHGLPQKDKMRLHELYTPLIPFTMGIPFLRFAAEKYTPRLIRSAFLLCMLPSMPFGTL